MDSKSTSPILKAALELYDSGMSILAWSYEYGPKRPIHKWKDLQRKRLPRHQLAALFTHNPNANIGVITGQLSSIVVIDADNDAAVDWCVENLPKTPWTVITGRGVQFGYEYPDVEVKNGQNVLQIPDGEDGPRIDIRGEGGYVAVPPSLHKSGSLYMWEKDIPMIERVAFMPVYDPEWMPAKKVPAFTEGPPIKVEQSRAFRRASAWIAKRDPAVEGSGGDRHTFITAANLVNDFALNEDQAWALLTDWNRTCSPPWSERDLRVKFNSAKKSGSAQKGSKPDRQPAYDHDLIANKVESWASATGERPAPKAEEPPEFLQNDSGLADQLLYYYGNKLRYCWPWERWLIWDGNRWKKDERGMAMHLAKQSAIKNPDEKWVHKSLGISKLNAALSIARSSTSHTVTPDMLDRNTYDLNVLNGTVDLRDGRLKPPSPKDHNTKICQVPYKINAECPRWELFLEQIFDNDKELISYIQQAVGYSLTAAQTDHLFFFCYGTGSNGKTTFLKTLLNITGDYGRQTPHDLLMEKRFNTHPTELAFLQGLRLAVGTEVKEGSGFDEGRLNMLTGADIITARFMRGDFFDFAPTHHLWLAGNHKPRVKATTYGLWRRMRLIPFSVQFKPEEMDRTLPEKLQAEWPGILQWAIRGAISWHNDGFKTPEVVRKATKAYQNEENVFASYLHERYSFEDGARTSAKSLREDYVSWCEDQGFRPLGARAMGSRLRNMGHEVIKSNGTRHWSGLRWNP